MLSTKILNLATKLSERKSVTEEEYLQLCNMSKEAHELVDRTMENVQKYRDIARDTFTDYNYEDALDIYLWVLATCEQLEHNPAGLHMEVGDAFFELKRYEEALLHYDRETGRPEKEILERKGQTFLEMDHYEEAIESFKSALARENEPSPTTAGLHSDIACAYSALERYEEALFHHEQALRICEEKDASRVPSVLHDIGACLCDMERYEEAIEYLERALPLPMDNSLRLDLHSNLAHAYDSNGDHEKAVLQYREAQKQFQQGDPEFNMIEDLIKNLTEK